MSAQIIDLPRKKAGGLAPPATGGAVVQIDQIVTLYAEWLALDTETDRISEAMEDAQGAELQRLEARYDEKYARWNDIGDRIRIMTAMTLEGLAAQARILAWGSHVFGSEVEADLANKIAVTLDRMATRGGP